MAEQKISTMPELVGINAGDYIEVSEDNGAVGIGEGIQEASGASDQLRGKLYDVVQGHTTQADWTPNIVPALFSEIQAPAGSGYPEWAQPVGAHDAYQMGDRVTFNGKNYESLINANVWSPVAYPQGWKEIS